MVNDLIEKLHAKAAKINIERVNMRFIEETNVTFRFEKLVISGIYRTSHRMDNWWSHKWRKAKISIFEY